MQIRETTGFARPFSAHPSQKKPGIQQVFPDFSISSGRKMPRAKLLRTANREIFVSGEATGAGILDLYSEHGLSGHEHLPPVSVPFRRFLSRLTCWVLAQRRSLGAKIARKLPAHRCFAVFTEWFLAEARRRPQGILLYFQGLERSIGQKPPMKTGRGSYPLSPDNEAWREKILFAAVVSLTCTP